MPNIVHNHLPWRGPLADGGCTETKLENGKLVGWCLGSEKTTMQHDIRKDIQVSLVLDKEDLYQLSNILTREQNWFNQHKKYGSHSIDLADELQAIVKEALS